MRGVVRELAALGLRCSGATLFVRRIIARRKATIILYHNPTPQHFERHLGYLSKRFNFVTMDQLDEAYRTGDWSRMPSRSLIVTFDDGHSGNYRLLPLFQRYGLRPTIFLVSGVVATHRHYWFAHEGVQSNRMKTLPEEERRAALRERFGFEHTREYPGPRQALSAEEIREMAPFVDFQAHTRFHPVLPTCDDEQSLAEIRDGRDDLERLLGRPVRYFSYPNGDYCERDVGFVRQCGFTLARTIDLGWNGPTTDRYLLKISGVTDDASVNVLAAQFSGIPMYLRYRMRGGKGGRFVQGTPAPAK